MLRWSEVDRLLALALTIYEDSVCPGCGQMRKYSMDGDLLHEWTVPTPDRCGSCAAIEAAAERARKDYDQPGSMRYLPMLKAGWEDRKAEAVKARSTSSG